MTPLGSGVFISRDPRFDAVFTSDLWADNQSEETRRKVPAGLCSWFFFFLLQTDEAVWWKWNICFPDNISYRQIINHSRIRFLCFLLLLTLTLWTRTAGSKVCKDVKYIRQNLGVLYLSHMQLYILSTPALTPGLHQYLGHGQWQEMYTLIYMFLTMGRIWINPSSIERTCKVHTERTLQVSNPRAFVLWGNNSTTKLEYHILEPQLTTVLSVYSFLNQQINCLVYKGSEFKMKSSIVVICLNNSTKYNHV